MTYHFTRTAHVSLSADEWDLYTDSNDCTAAAAALNAAAESAIESSQTAAEAMAKFSPVLDQWRRFGASDTEPRWVAADLFKNAFGA